jgi:hypothetical protein
VQEILSEAFYDIDEAQICNKPTHRSSTFPIRTKPTLKPKIVKELALFPTLKATFHHLETV